MLPFTITWVTVWFSDHRTTKTQNNRLHPGPEGICPLWCLDSFWAFVCGLPSPRLKITWCATARRPTGAASECVLERGFLPATGWPEVTPQLLVLRPLWCKQSRGWELCLPTSPPRTVSKWSWGKSAFCGFIQFWRLEFFGKLHLGRKRGFRKECVVSSC